MRKIVTTLLLLTLSLFAAGSFWEMVLQTEEKFFPNETILRLISDTNTTMTMDENETNALLESRLHAYKGLVLKLKNEPYSLETKHNPYYNPKSVQEEINTLLLKIDINRKYGYLQAVERDKIRLQTLRLRGEIYTFFHYLADNWTALDEKSLDEYIHKERESFSKLLTFKEVIAVYEKVASQKGDVATQVKENFFTLARDYYFFDTFLDYLTINAKLLTYRSIAKELRLDNLITYINKLSIARVANTYLRYIKLDTGRLFLFLFVILFFWLLNYLVYKRLYRYFRSRILEEEDATDEVMIDNLDRIRRPVSLLINGIGLKVALEVVNYPSPLSDRTDLIFYLFFIALGAWILMLLTENIFFLYFYRQREKRGSQMRVELINLMLSVTKVLILLVALMVALVKMHVNITGLLASLGIGGLAVALAAQTTLSNFFGLLKIIFDESFSQGDWIETKDVEGTVVETGFISTKIRTFDNALITVPNAELANTPLKNWSRRTVGRRIRMIVGVTYGARKEALDAAINDLREMLQNHPGIATREKVDYRSIKRRFKEGGKFIALEDKAGVKTTLLVFLDQFNQSSIDILIYAFSTTTDWQKWLAIKQDVMFKIMEILERHQLAFAFPSQTLYFDRENLSESAEAVDEVFKGGRSLRE